MTIALAKKFETQALLSNIRDVLHNLRQRKESIGESARKILAKTKVAFQGEDKNIPRNLAIDFFIKRLRTDIRGAIRPLPDADDFFGSGECRKRVSRLEQERREDYKIVDSHNSLVINGKVETVQRQVNSLRTPIARQQLTPYSGQIRNTGYSQSASKAEQPKPF